MTMTLQKPKNQMRKACSPTKMALPFRVESLASRFDLRR